MAAVRLFCECVCVTRVRLQAAVRQDAEVVLVGRFKPKGDDRHTFHVRPAPHGVPMLA